MNYSITIPLAPITKKNHQQIIKARGRYMLIQSKSYRDYEKACKDYLYIPDEPIDYPVNVKCIFYMGTRRNVDKTNLENAINDILVKYGVLEDDNRDIIASSDGTRVLYDKENPRTEITITPYEGEYTVWKKKGDK